MTDRSPALSRDRLTRRALELDSLAAILPMDRRDRLAEILTDEDVATLKHLAKEGMGENSLRALASDLAYLEAWAPASVQLGDPASLERRGRSLQIGGAALGDPAGGARNGPAADPEEQKSGDGGCARNAARDVLLRSPCRCARRGAASRRFCLGRRRRSEVAGLRVEQLIEVAPVPSDPSDPKASALPCLSNRLGRTKTTEADADARVFLVGRPVAALREWLSRVGIGKGPMFRAIDQWGGFDDKALTPQAVNWILKRRIAFAGLDPKEFSAHGLRAGYLTEAARRGVSLPEAMQQSQHRSVQQAASYYNEAERRQGRAARLI